MDNAHAHPQSPASTLHVRSRSIPPSLRDYRTSHTTPKSAPHTRQQRILQTRHARFSAQRLSVNGITVPFPPLTRSTENDTPYFSSPRLAKREEDGNTSDRTGDLTGSSTQSSILYELTNSSGYRLRGLQRRAPIPVFQDDSEKCLTPAPGSHTPSVYHDASSDIQPSSTSDSAQDCSPTMGLREVSVNLHRTSPHKDSPFYRSIRSGVNRKSSQGKSRFNSEEYIEHIENELQLVKDSMYSPTTHVPWKDKLKKAKDENDRLRKELDSMRSSFELELHQTVERSTEIELRLKRRIKDLEDEVDHKQSVIQDLEGDRDEKRFDQNTMEALKTRIEKLEEEKASLETTNRDMTKRNEVLTHLLALSPTKTQHGADLHTSRRKHARPMSVIIPRMPSSPDSQLSKSRPQSIIASPALAASEYFTNIVSSPMASSPTGIAPISPKALDDSRSVNSILGESCIAASNSTQSRRSTLGSSTTSSNSPDMAPISHIRTESRPQLVRYPSKRRPRKFMPGSTQLKPLLLPSFTAGNGNLPPASPMTSPNRPMSAMTGYVTSQSSRWEPLSPSQGRDGEHEEAPLPSPSGIESGQPEPSFQSLDEVFSKDMEPFETIGQHTIGGEVQNCSAQYSPPLQNTLLDSAASIASLDNFEISEPFDSWGVDMTPIPANGRDRTVHDSVEMRDGERLGYDSTFSEALGCQLDDPSIGPMDDSLNVPRPLFSRHWTEGIDTGQSSAHLQYQESSATRRKHRKGSLSFKSRESEANVNDPNSLDPPRGSTRVRPILRQGSVKRSSQAFSKKQQPSISREKLSTKARNPLEMLRQRGIGSRPLAALTVQAIYATLSRYTSYIQSFKRDPFALARRVIANAWRSNWVRLGKLSWWVLGLFIGYRYPDPDQVPPDWDKYDGESIADRCCIPPRNNVPQGNVSDENNGRASKVVGEHKKPPALTESDPGAPTIAPEPPPKEPKTGWGHSLFLWGKFSVALMLAVGGAIVNGPAEMLQETEERRRSRTYPKPESRDLGDTYTPPQSVHVDVATDAADQRKQIRKENDSTAEDPPGSVRKARSLSSPLPSPGGRAAAAIDASRLLLKDKRDGPGSEQASEDQPCKNELSSMDDTLKPTRSERKGWEDIFQHPNPHHPRPGQSISSIALSDSALDSHISCGKQPISEHS